jgi:hypothetical protein
LAASTLPESSSQRGQPQRRQRLTSGLGALEVQPRRHHGCTGKMRPQQVQPFNGRGVGQPVARPGQDDRSCFAGRQRKGRRRAPPHVDLEPVAAVGGLLLQLGLRAKVDVAQKTLMAGLVHAGRQLAAPVPAVGGKSLGNLLRVFGGRPGDHVGVRDEQRGARGVGQFRGVAQNLRPEFRHEAAFVDPVDQLSVGGCAAQRPRASSKGSLGTEHTTPQRPGQADICKLRPDKPRQQRGDFCGEPLSDRTN